MSAIEHFNPELQSPYRFSDVEIAMDVAASEWPLGFGDDHRYHEAACFGAEVLEEADSIVTMALMKVILGFREEYGSK